MGSMMCHWHLDCSPRRAHGPHGFALRDQQRAKYDVNLGEGDGTRPNLSHLILRRLHSLLLSGWLFISIHYWRSISVLCFGAAACYGMARHDMK